MALSFSQLTAAGSGSNLTSYDTASISPTTGSVMLVEVASVIGSGTPTIPTLSGLGATWTQIETCYYDQTGTTYRVTAFRGVGGSGSGVITIDFGGVTQAGCGWCVDEVTGADTTNPVVQSAKSSEPGSGGNSITATLASAITSGNRAWFCAAYEVAEASTPESGWTSLGGSAHSGPQNTFGTMYSDSDTDNSATVTWTTSSVAGAIIVEIQEASTSISGSANITQESDTLSSAGVLPIDGDSSQTEAGNTLSSDSDLLLKGTSTVSQDHNTVSAVIALTPIDGSVNVTQNDNSVTSESLLEVAGSSNLTQASDTTSASGVLPVEAVASITQSGDTLSSDSDLQIKANADITQDNNTVFSSSSQLTEGAANLTQDDNAVVASSVVLIEGSVAVDQEGDSVSSAGVGSMSGSVTITQDGNTLESVSAIFIVASSNMTQDGNTLDADQSTPFTGPGNVRPLKSRIAPIIEANRHKVIKAKKNENIEI
jgi:hypothetical protein